ncbi:MAG: PAS domain S-box protein [Chitinophagales bacterium]|nr:PAS domain S-box protein [Chitinophagales bacterium]MDW8273466.1 PAS domain S-box protein [Chitinophagales bacterium]
MYLFEENKLKPLDFDLYYVKREIEAILNTAGSSVLLLNKRLEVQFYSKGILDLYNISNSDIGKKISEIEGYFSDCDVTFYAQKILKENTGFRGKVTTQHGKHFLKRMMPFRTEDRGIVGIIVAFTDITELENAKHALEVSEARFRDMAEVAVDYFFELAKDGTIVYVSPSMTESLGYTPEEVLGRKIAEFIPSNEAEYVIRHAVKHTQHSDVYPPVTHHVIKKDGTQIIVEARGKAIRDSSGKLIGYRAINRNITDRISLEKEQEHLNRLLEQRVSERTRELEEKQQQLEEAQRLGKIGSWVWNPNTGYLFWSDMMYEIFELKNSPETSFEDFKKRVHPEDIDALLQKEKEAIKSGASFYESEYRIVNNSGEVRYLYSIVHLNRNELGKVTKLIGIAHDITDVKQREEEKRKLINDLIQQNKELQHFNYIVSHNLRAPVANLIGLAKLFRKNESSERNNKIIDSIYESALSIDEILKDLSNILQLRGVIAHEREKVLISEVLAQVLKTMVSDIENINPDIITDFSAVDEVVTIRSYLHSILYNLISNALKYRHPHRKCVLQISSGLSENFIWIKIEDNGIGFDVEANKHKLFGLYKRLHDHVEGKGMGLYLVKVQAETLGGWVDVQSQPDKGTTFTVFISRNH